MKIFADKNYGPGIAVIQTQQGKYIGPILKWRPEENYVSILNGLDTVIISFDDIKSGYEYDRISINSPPEGEKVDLLERAREDLKRGRELGWYKEDVPVKKWEQQ